MSERSYCSPLRREFSLVCYNFWIKLAKNALSRAAGCGPSTFPGPAAPGPVRGRLLGPAQVRARVVPGSSRRAAGGAGAAAQQEGPGCRAAPAPPLPEVRVAPAPRLLPPAGVGLLTAATGSRLSRGTESASHPDTWQRNSSRDLGGRGVEATAERGAKSELQPRLGGQCSPE
jgi:hypothetical protein